MDTKYFQEQFERIFADSIWLSNKIAETGRQFCETELVKSDAMERFNEAYKEYLIFQKNLFEVIEQLRGEKK